MSEEMIGFEIFALDLPFRQKFKHAAKERSSSESLMLRCVTSSRTDGFGETLPRPYVTGESLQDTCDFLKKSVLPRLLGLRFSNLPEVISFLEGCDGEPPADWVESTKIRTAAWCAVDLALLDAYSKAFKEQVVLGKEQDLPEKLRYSAVVSSWRGWILTKTLIKIRAYGFRQVKLKVDRVNYGYPVRLARRILGRECDIRIDANMDWTADLALRVIPELAGLGVRSFEQPLPSDDLDGAAQLVRDTGVTIMADEAFSNRRSLENLVSHRACNAVNVRLSKCGGLVASLARCRQAERAGVQVQIGCQVGETSLLSAAQLALLAAYRNIKYVEGAFGELLLQHDPCQPVIRFRYGGRPPVHPGGYGFGVVFDVDYLRRMAGRHEWVGDMRLGR